MQLVYEFDEAASAYMKWTDLSQDEKSLGFFYLISSIFQDTRILKSGVGFLEWQNTYLREALQEDTLTVENYMK